MKNTTDCYRPQILTPHVLMIVISVGVTYNKWRSLSSQLFAPHLSDATTKL